MKHKVINMNRSTLIILSVICIVLFIAPLIMYNGLGEDDGYFGGADGAAGEAIEETGFEPWFSSIWEPPSGEIESLLFALQAAIGAGVIGFGLGYLKGKKKVNDEVNDKHR